MGSSKKGYTILEVLIFIAVSSLMFISAITAIGGRQQQVQFAQGTKEFDSKIRDVINDVTTGYYPTNETVSCEVNSGEVEIINSKDQLIGTNSKCIYVGKVIQFQVDGDDTLIRIYSMAGKRFSGDSSTPVSTIDQARPKAVALPGEPTFIKPSEDYHIPYGLKVTRVIRPIGTDFTDYGAVAILSSFGGASLSESQSVTIGGIVGSEMSSVETVALLAINKLTDTSVSVDKPTGYLESNTAEGLVICLESQEGRKASLNFGIKNSSTTELNIDDYNEGCE